MKQIAILGPGTVGGGVAEILMKNADTVAASAGEDRPEVRRGTARNAGLPVRGQDRAGL